jgi:hypothetical protein
MQITDFKSGFDGMRIFDEVFAALSLLYQIDLTYFDMNWKLSEICFEQSHERNS